MKNVKNYICVVDSSRWQDRKHRYRVGAKTEKEAKELLQAALGEVPVKIHHEDLNPVTCHMANYQECYRETFDSEGRPTLVQAGAA